MGNQGGHSLKTVKVLALNKYGRMGASSRMRSLQYLPLFGQLGLHVTVRPLLSDEFLSRRYQQGTYAVWSLLQAYSRRLCVLLARKQFDVVWIEKEALPWWPLWLELVLLHGVPYVLDYDDAVFHNYDQHANIWVRRLFGRRLDGLMVHAALVMGGNNYLAQRAREAGAPWVEVVPTVIDLERYPCPPPFITECPTSQTPGGIPRIVWIGSPSTAQFLKLLREPLKVLASQLPFVFVTIGCDEVDFPGVQTEVLPWTEATEVKGISACQIGVMPLFDTPFAREKCAYKLIQYMACGLPVVASHVGANPDVVRDGVDGFLVNTVDEWVTALSQLLVDGVLRRQMGAAGRQRVEDEYCTQKTGPKIAQLLRTISGRP